MANWLNQDFLFGNEIVPALQSTAPIDTSQTPALINEMQTVGGTNYILIGHSQGGLVSRYAAQYFQNNPPDLAEGVITVDTPNEGANATVEGPMWISAILVDMGTESYGHLGCTSPFDNIGCELATITAQGGVALQPALSAYTSGSSWNQLEPGSSFLTTLNAQQENFKQAAVIGLTPQFYAFTRIAANAFFHCNPEDWCGERNVAVVAQIFFYSMVAAELYYAIALTVDCQTSDEAACLYDIQWLSFLTDNISVQLIINGVYDSAVDFPGDGSSDAIVQGPSQYYPSTAASQFVIPGADSHTGALKSSFVHEALDEALRNSSFNVPTPASCTFSVPETAGLFGNQGGSASFPVTTTNGCSWSAETYNPWITITSGVNGTSSGTVGFSVVANPVTVPRLGSIEVGNGTASAIYQINQTGECYYMLSEGPMIAAPAAGTSDTVQVTAPGGCPWVAASNINWLTISSGASGTGSGSFTYTVAANTTGVGREGTITVGNITLTIVDGVSGGAVSTGLVTIAGQEKTHVYDPCPPSHCYAIAYESGTVSLTVDGNTFTATYGSSSDTALSVAQNLASKLNYSMTAVSAQAAAVTSTTATITLTSTVSGAETNYPLAASATFDQYCPVGTVVCFSTPAFTAQLPTPPSMTGGTN
jgi:hypothetical protein